ncbi:chromate transporter [Fibrella forsythiae]|uniref:Chromate transporter n=1 Tax=Fibrella forsythiae TaxID=2817061 RepID=A0ABS3JHM7_9BACT|nr:chromate transporter [Fibrella forsythiae]MBO0949521.1 chromate transporter [Fibrella forsythiae]
MNGSVNQVNKQGIVGGTTSLYTTFSDLNLIIVMAEPAVLEPELAPIFTSKAPFQLPDNIKEIIVKVAPYVSVILLPLSVLAIVLGGGVAILSGFFLNIRASISLLIIVAALVIGILAIPGLFKRTRESWTKLYLAQLLYLLSSIVSFDVFGFIISFLIGLFMLFQIREKYTN